RASPWWAMRKPPLSMINAVVASLFSSNSWRTVSNCWTSSSMSWGNVAMSCVLRRGLADKFIEQHSGNHVESFKDPFAQMRAGFKGRHLHIPVIDQEFHIIDRRRIGQIAFIVLEHVRNVGKVQL